MVETHRCAYSLDPPSGDKTLFRLCYADAVNISCSCSVLFCPASLYVVAVVVFKTRHAVYIDESHADNRPSYSSNNARTVVCMIDAPLTVSEGILGLSHNL
ncbi:hypothetical protein C2S51_037947 [Perilla frutescens var. frutescens]|nr:hypothetical protein C2S51_037947 [Perilla frutescens var. frutescens]